MSHEDEEDQVLRKLLKEMPIWDEHEKTKARLMKLEHDLITLEDNVTSLQAKHPSSNVENGTETSKQQQQQQQQQQPPPQETSSKTIDKSIVTKDPNLRLLATKLQVDEEVYAMYEPGKPWVKGKVVSVFRKPLRNHDKPMIIIRVKIEMKEALDQVGHNIIDVKKFEVARIQKHGNKLMVAKRVIAGRPSRMFPGIIARAPHEQNNNRYLVMMDDGSDMYFRPDNVLPIFYQSYFPWNDMRHLQNNDITKLSYLRNYFHSYPRRHLLACSVDLDIGISRKGALVRAKVMDIDADIIRIKYKDNSEENVYRGSGRLLLDKHELQLQLALVNTISNLHPDVVYSMAVYNEVGLQSLNEDYLRCIEGLDKNFYITKIRQSARKSTSTRKKKTRLSLYDVIVEENSEVQELSDDEINTSKHKCDSQCLEVIPRDENGPVRTEKSVIDIIDEFRNVSDLKVPLLLGWKRKLIRTCKGNRTRKQIVYIAPCGKIFKTPFDIRRYIGTTNSIFDIDYFTFDTTIVLNNPIEVDSVYYEENIAVDKKTGRALENKFISLLNMRNQERLPVDFVYSNEVIPHPELSKRGFSFNEEFKSSCDCEDDCRQRSTCPCHRLNEDFAGKYAHKRGTVDDSCQYIHKRLAQQVYTGVFECNSWCSCSSKCSNRVVQNGIRFRLQVQKMPGNKGWGVITLDDIPEGAFICTYSAELLDDADLYGNCDVYYADLDYITVNEANKEGNLDEDDKFDEGLDLDGDDNDDVNRSDAQPGPSSSSTTNKVKGNNSCKRSRDDEDSDNSVIELLDDDSSISSLDIESYRPQNEDGDENDDDDGGEDSPRRTRYPRRQTRTAISDQYKPKRNRNMNGNGSESENGNGNSRSQGVFKRLHRLLRSHDYTLDARMQGNVGRFFNHSCLPNAYVQNVFIESHDLRFPVVAFFATKTIRASSEITWNYNYKTGSIEGRRIDCECGAANCKGRIL